MDQGLVSLAFAAGLVAALNPCGFAMLPAYLVLVIRGEATPTGLAAVGRGGGVCRSAYPMPSAVTPPTTRTIASVVAALRGDHTFEELLTIDSD